ncbi:recombinase family protein [Clostridium sp.]|uniref:recombinase family protein n=1 Tax=Clostridium sp. TaxID=1506 RepID=UPI003216ED16
MRIAIYSRKSKYTGVGDSIENQVQMCKDYANAKYAGKDLEFLIYEDEGFSGGNLNRPKFKELMDNIKNYDVLICYRLDRISRNVADFSSTLEVLQSSNCDFVSIKEQFDTSTPMGRAMIYIASVFAQLERETIAERIKDNMLELAKNGKWSGGRVPLGYKSESTTYLDDEGKERKAVKLVQDHEELKLVKLIYETYLKEGSLHKTEVWFTQQGIKSNGGILLEKTTLKLILQNPVYVKSTPAVITYLKDDGWNVYGEADGVHGLLSYNKTESVSLNGKTSKRTQNKENWIAAMSSVEGIIDAEIWLKVQKQFNKNKDTFPRLGKTHNALLTGKIRCNSCKSYMKIQHGHKSTKTGETTYYYVCSMKVKSKGSLCSCKNAKVSEIETAVINEIDNLCNEREDFLKTFQAAWHKQIISNDKNIRKITLSKQIEDKEKQISNLVDKLSLDDSIADILIDKIKTYKCELAKFKNELEELNKENTETANLKYNIDLAEEFLNEGMNIKSKTREQQKQFIDIYLDKVIYDGDTETVDLELLGYNTSKKK